MYKIYADDVLIYDSTLEDYRISKGQITKEVGKSGSFVFSVYPDHPYYDRFVALRTVITVYKSGRIVFRGRVLDDKVDYWNNKELTCEGELGFLQDSIARPYAFQGTPGDLFKKFIEDHNAQVDDFKQFKLGTVDIQDANDYINRSSTEHSATLAMLGSALTDSALGGYFYITHGDDGADPVPTIHYLKDFPKVSAQPIEFGANLKDYVKTTKAEDVATAIIPLGAQASSTDGRLTIADVNDGVDYLYNEEAVALRGWVFKTVVWDDVTLADNLKAKAEAYLEHIVNQNITIELNAIDLHLLDRSIESYNVCEYVCARSKPHGFDAVMLCNKQTMDLLKPDNDKVVLGYETASFTGASTQMAANVSTLGKTVSSIKQDASKIELKVEEVDKSAASLTTKVDSIKMEVSQSTGADGQTYASITLHVGENMYTGQILVEGNLNVSGQLSADALYAALGDIADLTVDRLSTSRRIVKYLAFDTTDDNYIRAEDEELCFVSGVYAGGVVQASSPSGGPIYWESDPDADGVVLGLDGYPYKDGVRIFTTTAETDWPVMVYTYTEQVKTKLAFELMDGIYTPVLTLGAGNEQGQNKGIITKSADGLEVLYRANTGAEIGMRCGNGGYTDIYGLRKTTGLNFSEFDSGVFYERISGKTDRYPYFVQFDAQGNPVKITDQDGHECTITW